MDKEPSTTGSGTTPTQDELTQTIAAAFETAFETLAEDAAEVDDIRQHLRDLYGADQNTPLDFILTGFVLGFSKGIEAATGSTR